MLSIYLLLFLLVLSLITLIISPSVGLSLALPRCMLGSCSLVSFRSSSSFLIQDLFVLPFITMAPKGTPPNPKDKSAVMQGSKLPKDIPDHRGHSQYRRSKGKKISKKKIKPPEAHKIDLINYFKAPPEEPTRFSPVFYPDLFLFGVSKST